MLRKKLLKFFYLSFVIIAVFFFFSIWKSPVYAALVDLPITGILKGCQPDLNSVPTACLNADPSVGLSWDASQLNSTLCKGSCTYTVLRNGTNAIANLDQTQTDWKDLGVNTETGRLKNLTLYKYKIQAYASDGALVAETSAEKSITTAVCQCPNNFDLRSASNDCNGTTLSIQITWPRVDVDGWGEAKQYKIFRFTNESEDYQNYLLNINPSSYYIATVFAGNNWIQTGSYYYYNDNKDSNPNNQIITETPYYYRVVAFSESPRAGQASNHSLTRAAGMCPKPQITGLTTNEPDCSPARITLRWKDCENFSQDGCRRRTNYYIIRNGQAVNQFSQPQTTKCFCGGEVKPCCEWQSSPNALQCCSDDTQSILTNTPYNYSIKTTGNSWELNSDLASKTLTTCIPPTFPPPTSLAVDNTNCQSGSPIMILSWNHSTPDQVAYYYVYKYHCASGDISSCDTAPQATYPRTTSIQTFIDSQNVGLGQWYEYYIVAVNKTNVSSSPSDKIVSQARTNCNTSPPLPHQPVLLIDLQCSTNNAPQMYLSWTPVYNDGGRVTNYYVFRDDNNDGLYEKDLTPQGLQQSFYFDTNVSQGQIYSYVIEARGPGGYIDSSSKSATARTDCDKPGPFSLNQPTASCGGGQYTVNLSWTLSTPAATGYDVFYKLNDSTSPTCDTPPLPSNGWLASISQTSYSYSFPNTQAGTYYYFIRAKITGSNKCTFDAPQKSIQLFGAVPQSPTINQAATRAYCDGWLSKIDVAWSAVSNAQSYTPFYCLGSSCTPNTPLTTTNNTSASFSGVIAGQDYTIAVRANGSCENSPLSTSVVRTGSNCPPGGLTLSGSSVCQGNNNPAYTLSWSTAGGVGVHYDLYRNSSVFISNATSPVSDNPGQGTFTYYVKAINTAGSADSNSYIGNLNCAPPQPFVLNNPQILTCYGGYPVIGLSWSVPTNGASYYKIYRCEGCTDAQLKTSTYLLTSGVLTENYRDQGSATNLLVSGHTYRYQVEAVKNGVTTTAFASSAVSATPGLCQLPNLIADLSPGCDTSTPAQPRLTLNWHWDSSIDTGLLSKYDVFKVTPATNSYNDFSPSPAFANLSPSITQKQDSYPLVQNNISYSYYVKATTISGNSVSSNIVSGSADCLPPSGNLTLENPSQLCDPAIGIALNWTYDGAETVYYKLSKKIGAGSFNEIFNTGSKSYTDRAVSPGNSYSYKVKVCKTINNICQESQTRLIPPTGLLPDCLPGKPTNLQLTSRCQAATPVVELAWQAPAGQNATGYRILRTKVSDGGTTLIQVGNVTSKTDDTPSSSTAYTYQIIAYNLTYDCSNCSGACAGQCSTSGSVTTNSCDIANPQLFADRCCVGNPTDQCLNYQIPLRQYNNLYGNYTHLYWQADESTSSVFRCRLEKKESGTYVAKTPTFHSHAELNGNTIDNISASQAYNSTYNVSSDWGKFTYSVSVPMNVYSSPPPYIDIFSFALPAANRDVMLDFWFHNATWESIGNYSLLWKRSETIAYPQLRLIYYSNFTNLNMAAGRFDSLNPNVYLASGLTPASGWHHFLFSQRYSNNETKVYLDKALVYNGAWQNFYRHTDLYFGGAAPPIEVQIGSSPAQYISSVAAYFDEIKIWPDKIQNQRQVQKLYDDVISTTPLPPIAMIAAGHEHTCALLTNGEVWCWGWNASGQLGDGTLTDRSYPVKVLNLSSPITAISAGSDHTCAVDTNKNVWCWGSNLDGQLGNNNTNPQPGPVRVQQSGGSPLANVTKISAGYSHTCALAIETTSQSGWCWGKNLYGQIGNGSSGGPVPYAYKIASLVNKIADISAGRVHSCAAGDTTQNQAAVCWGLNLYGQLGNNSSSSNSPVYVKSTSGAGTLTLITKISAGGNHTCAVDSNHNAFCWGWNASGQVGQGNTNSRYYPFQIPVLNGLTTDISAGDAHSCAALSSPDFNQTVACWGKNYNGQLGNDTTADLYAPTAPNRVRKSTVVNDFLTNVTKISAGNAHTCALDTNKNVWCWGRINYGQLSNPNIVNQSNIAIAPAYWRKEYETAYDDFTTGAAGTYDYKVVCTYSDSPLVERTTTGSFTFSACPPDVSFEAPNDLAAVCSELAAKNQETENPNIGDCSGDYVSPDSADIEPAYQSKAPYVLLSWNYDSAVGNTSFTIYKYEGTTKNYNNPLATFSTQSGFNCLNGQCKCKDRSAGVKDTDGNYKKFHYFIVAGSPPGPSIEKDFPSSIIQYGLNCQSFSHNPIYLSPACDQSSPGVQIFLKDSISPTITSYWNGKSDNLTLAGGVPAVTKTGNTGVVSGIANDAGGATHIDAPATTVSWAALGNSNDTAIAADPSTPYSVSMWLKFDSASAPSLMEVYFANKIPSESTSYLVLTRQTSGKLGIYTKSTTDSSPYLTLSPNTVADTNWHHLKASWLINQDGITKEMKFWYDFNLVAQDPAITNSTLVLGSPTLRTITLGSTLASYNTAKAAVDEVYLTQNTPDNDPYYYEIFRKRVSGTNPDTEYKYVVTLDSNAYLYLENINSNNGLIGGEAYSYKVRIVSTDSNQTSLLRDLGGVFVESDCLSVSANSECDDVSGLAKVSLTWDDSIKPGADNEYQILIKKSSDFIWQPPQELSAYQSTPDTDGSYCEAVSEGSSVLRCYYNFWVSGLTSYDFQIQRYLEPGERGYQATVPTIKSSGQNTILTTKCYDQDPTPFHIYQLAPCCFDGGSCLVSGLGKPAVTVTWYDADYAYRYKIYRDCLAGDLSDCEAHGVWVADYSSSLDDVCQGGTNSGNQCLVDAACPGGTCGPQTYTYLDLGVGFGEAHTYRIFAIGRKVEADDPPAGQITTPENGSGGCLLKPLQPTITNISRTCIGTSPTHQISWIPPDDPNFTLEKWLIFVGEASLGGNTAYSDFKLKSSVAATPPPNPTLSYGGGALSVNNIYNYQIMAQATDGTLSDPSDPWPEDQITPVCVWPPRKDLINLHLSDYSDCHKITFAFDIKDSLSGHADDWAEGYEIYRLTSEPTSITDKYYYCNCQYNSGVLGCLYSGSCPTNDNAYYKNKKLSDLGNTPFSSIYPSRNAASYTFEDTGFHPGYIYYWAVDSYNSRGYSTSTESNIFGLSKFCKGGEDSGNSCTDNSQCSSNVCSVGFPTKECAQPPAKSTITAASECPDKVKLSWPNPADTTATHYKIYRRGLEESNFILLGICGEGTKKGMGCVSDADCRDLTHSDVTCDTNPLLACVNPQGGRTGCFNAFVDAPGALTAIYKYSIVSVAEQQIEIDGVPKTFYIEGDSVEENARACFKLPRWQELPGVTP